MDGWEEDGDIDETTGDMVITDPNTGEAMIVEWKVTEGMPLRLRDQQLEQYKRFIAAGGFIVETADEHAERLEREKEDETAEDLALLHKPGAHDDWVDEELAAYGASDDEVAELQRRLEADPMHDPVFFDDDGEVR